MDFQEWFDKAYSTAPRYWYNIIKDQHMCQMKQVWDASRKEAFTKKEIKKDGICLCSACEKTKECNYFKNGMINTSTNTTEVTKCLK